MADINAQGISSILSQLEAIRESLRHKTIACEAEAVIAFEHIRTLDYLHAAFVAYRINPTADFTTKLKEFLAERWERIRHSPSSYVQRPFDPVNQLCLSIAKLIEPLPDNCELLAPKTGPYFLLMPTLTAWKDAANKNIHNLALQQFVLSDEQNLFIPLEDCLRHAMDSDSAVLMHMVCNPANRYSLKIVYLKDAEVLSDDDIPEHVLCIYLRDGVITAQAKNKEPFVLSEEELLAKFKEQLTEGQLAELDEERQQEKCQEAYESLKKTLTPVTKKTVLIHKNNQSGELSCLITNPPQPPVRLKFDAKRLGDYANLLNAQLRSNGQKPYVSLRDDGELIVSIQTVDRVTQEYVLSDAHLDTAQLQQLRDHLKQDIKQKAFTIGEEAAIFNRVAVDGYYRENAEFYKLSEKEEARVINHTKATKDYYQHLSHLHRVKGNASSLGNALYKLYVGLGGGIHRGGEANVQAITAIAVFSDYWNSYTDMEKGVLYLKYPGLKDIITRLYPPNGRLQSDDDFGPCIGLTAQEISRLLKRYPSLYQDDQALKEYYYQELKASFTRPNYLLIEDTEAVIELPDFQQLRRIYLDSRYGKLALQYILQSRRDLPDDLIQLILSLPNLERQFLLNVTDSEGNTVFMRSVTSASFNTVNQLLKTISPAQRNARNKRGETALMRTVFNKKDGAKMAELLIKSGADPLAKNRFGDHTTTLAVRHGNLEVLAVLVRHSKDPAVTKGQLIDFARATGSPLLEELENQYETNGGSTSQMSLFENITRLGGLISTANTPTHDQRVIQLYRCVLSLQTDNQEQVVTDLQKIYKPGRNYAHEVLRYAALTNPTLLLRLTGEGQESVLMIFLQALQSINDPFVVSTLLNARSVRDNSNSLLMKVVNRQNQEAVRALIHLGVDLDAWNAKEQTALSSAIDKRNWNIVIALLDAGCDIRPLDNQDNIWQIWTEYFYPAIPDAVIERFLLKAITLTAHDQALCLKRDNIHYANFLEYCFYEKRSFLPKLLTAIVDIEDEPTRYALLNASGKYGNPLLHEAVKEALATEEYTTLRQLIDAGVDVLVSNDRGESPVTVAIQQRPKFAYRMVEFLLAKGALLTSRDIFGSNVLDHALSLNCDSQIITLLLTKATQLPRAEQSEFLANVGDYHDVLVYTLDKHPNHYEAVKAAAPFAQRQRIEQGLSVLETLNFDEYLAKIHNKYLEFQRRWYFPSEKNRAVIRCVKRLHDNLQAARLVFLESDVAMNDKKWILRSSCLEAIQQARPILKPHRGIGVLLDALVNAFNIRLIIMERINTGKWNFFQSETKSTQLMSGLGGKIEEAFSPSEDSAVGGSYAAH